MRMRVMLLIKNFMGPSRIHGMGLFAAENIRKGTTIWEFNPLVDLILSEENFDALPECAKEYFKIYSYRNRVTGHYVMSFDNDRYTNHSPNPNTINKDFYKEEGVTIAKSDIFLGEEITANYTDFDGKEITW